MRTAFVTGAVVAVAFAIAPALASAAGKTYVAGPGGDGNECTSAAPCELARAVELAGDGDSVHLDGGTYKLPFSGKRIDHEIDLGGTPDEPATIETEVQRTLSVGPKANATLHDLRYLGAGPLNLESGSADRVYVDYIGSGSPVTSTAACELGLDTTLRDSVCWAREAGESTDAHAIQVVVFGEGLKGTTTLRNDTAIASDDGGSGLFVEAGSGSRYSVDVNGLIAHSTNRADITAALVQPPASIPEVHATVTHSDFATVVQEAPYATVTGAGTNGNVTAAPVFVDATAGDFHQMPGSPTIDGALADTQTAALDFDGQTRAKPGCIGAGDVPDMGAYEFTAVAPCPLPPPPPPPEPEPRQPVFRIVKVSVHGAGGTIQVEVPDEGKLTLTGLGVKLVSRPAPAPGAIVTLPIRPWAITKVRLNRTGKTRVKLSVKFAPNTGVPHQKARNVLLTKG